MSAAVPVDAHLSIGEVLAVLRPDFPDVTISKIRFLEAEGLVEPSRTPSGYRKFSRADVERLRYVLTVQRDHYLPLRVIKDHLDAIDRGLEPPAVGLSGPRPPRALVAADGIPTADSFRSNSAEVRLTRTELVESAGIDERQLDQLEEYGLITAKSGRTYDMDALSIARSVADMAAFGLEARHLRSFKTAADREIGLIEQVVTPMARQRGPEARARADEAVRELAAISVRLHTLLVKTRLPGNLSR